MEALSAMAAVRIDSVAEVDAHEGEKFHTLEITANLNLRYEDACVVISKDAAGRRQGENCVFYFTKKDGKWQDLKGNFDLDTSCSRSVTFTFE